MKNIKHLDELIAQKVCDSSIDDLIGFNKSLRTGSKRGWVPSQVGGVAQWSEGEYETPWKTLNLVLHLTSQGRDFAYANKKAPLIVDVGCSFSRLGVLVGASNRRWGHITHRYIGYEISDFKVKLAKKNTDKMPGVDIIQQDLSSPEFKMPAAQVYYMYDPVNLETLPIVLDKIVEAAPEGSKILFRHGTHETSHYMRKHMEFVMRYNDHFSIFLPRRIAKQKAA